MSASSNSGSSSRSSSANPHTRPSRSLGTASSGSSSESSRGGSPVKPSTISRNGSSSRSSSASPHPRRSGEQFQETLPARRRSTGKTSLDSSAVSSRKDEDRSRKADRMAASVGGVPSGKGIISSPAKRTRTNTLEEKVPATVSPRTRSASPIKRTKSREEVNDELISRSGSSTLRDRSPARGRSPVPEHSLVKSRGTSPSIKEDKEEFKDLLISTLTDFAAAVADTMERTIDNLEDNLGEIIEDATATTNPERSGNSDYPPLSDAALPESKGDEVKPFSDFFTAPENVGRERQEFDELEDHVKKEITDRVNAFIHEIGTFSVDNGLSVPSAFNYITEVVNDVIDGEKQNEGAWKMITPPSKVSTHSLPPAIIIPQVHKDEVPVKSTVSKAYDKLKRQALMDAYQNMGKPYISLFRDLKKFPVVKKKAPENQRKQNVTQEVSEGRSRQTAPTRQKQRDDVTSTEGTRQRRIGSGVRPSVKLSSSDDDDTSEDDDSTTVAYSSNRQGSRYGSSTLNERRQQAVFGGSSTSNKTSGRGGSRPGQRR